jgi:23S rRNA (cytidine1920-2'-O)/16S rRNA (cytidine1409-2'-O)-methyltransferase
MAKNKQRLDSLLQERGLAPTRKKAQAMIMAGEVRVNGQRVTKPGMMFPVDSDVSCKEKLPFVSRGGLKLEKALFEFDVNVSGLICADVGASTGGFTDCLLQNGAKRVYAIDVGYGHLAHKLRIDERVIVMERTNARYVEALDEPVDLVVIDASFISLRLILPVVSNWLRSDGSVIALIKPQFEARKADVGEGGLVNDSSVHAGVIREVVTFADDAGFVTCGLTISPVTGRKSGNTEFLIWLCRGDAHPVIDLDTRIAAVLEQS